MDDNQPIEKFCPLSGSLRNKIFEFYLHFSVNFQAMIPTFARARKSNRFIRSIKGRSLNNSLN